MDIRRLVGFLLRIAVSDAERCDNLIHVAVLVGRYDTATGKRADRQHNRNQQCDCFCKDFFHKNTPV